MKISETENSRVAILGTGREGQAVWRQMRRRFPGKPLYLFSESTIDQRFRQQLDPVIDVIREGPMDVTTLGQFDLLVRSAGISVYRQELRELRSQGVQFTSASSLWFAENPEARTICITGTLGKSTTATLIAQLLVRAGVRAVLAGNIGMPMLDCSGGDAEWWVIELSSYQISDIEAEPDIVVFLNISEDHLDWHQGVENYKSDKMRLAQLVSNGRIIANFSDKTLREGFKNQPGITWFNRPGNWQAGGNNVFRQRDDSGLYSITRNHVSAPDSLPGEHNMQNLAAALTVVETLGLDVPRLDEALSAFIGLPHRLQLIGERNGIRYVNDSISTTPVSVGAALQTIGGHDVALLLGGMERGLDWSAFANRMADSTPYAIITLPDNGQRIFDCLKREGVEPEGGLHAVSGLKEAVALAEKLVPEGGCILLSPGAPSFPHFRDFAERGEQFRKFSGF